MHSPQTIEVDSVSVACDGGGGALGHPRVYLSLEKKGQAWCPYCSRHFKLKAGAGHGSH